MKVLVFYACYGGGHLSAAKSIKQYIDDNYKDAETDICDCMKYVNAKIEKITVGAYNGMARKMPWAWGKFYFKSEKGFISAVSNFSNRMMSKKLLKKINEVNPDIIISTHPFSSQMCAYLKKKGKINCMIASVMTDFASHNQWLVCHEFLDQIFVSNENMRQSIIKKGIDENKIFATGIPLSNRFLANFNKAEIKDSFGLSKDKKTILFFGGGEFGLGGDRTMKILEAFIDNIKDEYQMVVIAGKNEDMKKAFEKLVAEKKAEENVFVQGFSTQVPELMSVSNLVVTKPGGLTSSESLVSGLPMVIINPIPGQEEQNAEFLVDAGIALWLKKKDDINKEISELLADQDRLQQMKIKAKLLAKANSTKDICSTILNTYNEGKYLKIAEEKGDTNE